MRGRRVKRSALERMLGVKGGENYFNEQIWKEARRRCICAFKKLEGKTLKHPRSKPNENKAEWATTTWKRERCPSRRRLAGKRLEANPNAVVWKKKNLSVIIRGRGKEMTCEKS